MNVEYEKVEFWSSFKDIKKISKWKRLLGEVTLGEYRLYSIYYFCKRNGCITIKPIKIISLTQKLL